MKSFFNSHKRKRINNTFSADVETCNLNLGRTKNKNS